jgi:hypothetical protein
MQWPYLVLVKLERALRAFPTAVLDQLLYALQNPRPKANVRYDLLCASLYARPHTRYWRVHTRASNAPEQQVRQKSEQSTSTRHEHLLAAGVPARQDSFLVRCFVPTLAMALDAGPIVVQQT